MTEARNWKWMMPAFVTPILLLLTRALYFGPSWTPWLCFVTGIAAVVLMVSAVANFFDYRRERAVSFLERKQNALAHTAWTSEMEAARGVSPESVKMLINERHRVWMLRSGVKDSGINPHSVMYGAPMVTEYFVQYFLESSTDSAVMPKRLLVEGRRNRFDPWGAVDEYTMYDNLIALLAREGKVHHWSEFDAYEWVHPWTPALVAESYGWEWKEPKQEEEKQ